MDFGLAKLSEASGSGASVAQGFSPAEGALSQSPTLTTPAATRMGVIMGTAAYMSPEQAKGRPVDKRADIWAVGCVLYEMLTGKRAFEGDDVSDTLARVLMKEPEWDALPATTSPAIRKLLRRCLAKDRRQRLSDGAAVRLEIDDALTTPSGETVAVALPPPSARVSRGMVAAAVAAALVVGAAVAGAVLWLTTRPAPPRVTRLTITPPATAPLTPDGVNRDLAIAPDGSRLVYVGANGTQLFVRALEQLVPTALSGVGGGPIHPVFSPDGQWIAFFDGITTLKKVATTGGSAITLSRITGGSPRGATWGPDDTVVFAASDTSTGLLRVGAAGGEPEVVTTPDRAAGEVDHLWPEALPGGRAVLFTITTAGGIDQAQIAVMDLRTGDKRVLVRGGSHAQYVAPGYLVYGAAGTLRAVAFELERLEVVGAPVPVVEAVVTTALGAADASVAADGTLVYVPGGGAPRRTLVWVDRQGREEALGAPTRAYRYPRLSPNGTQVAVALIDQEQDIWLWDVARQTPTRLTFDPAQDLYPVWTPDGRRLVWASGRAGPPNLYTQAADGTGALERLTESPNQQFPYAFAPDGTRLVLREDSPGTGSDLAVLVLAGERSAGSLRQAQGVPSSSRDSGRAEPVEPRRVTPLIQTPFNERNGEISPDGRWLAYESDESGQFEIYVRPFPEVDQGKWQVSTGGGRQPLWARRGRELFYRAPDGAVLGVSVDAIEGGGFRRSTPATLVAGQYYSAGGLAVGRTYDVSPDGSRFLMIKEGGGSDETAAPSIVVVQHWVEELKRLIPRN